MTETDLFGNSIEVPTGRIKEKYGVSPFSVLPACSPSWKKRKRELLSLGIRGEATRENAKTKLENLHKMCGMSGISTFDPVLCEVMYRWYCPVGGKVLDPFAGGSVRGIIAALMGLQYVGIEIREEQVKANEEDSENILNDCQIKPQWIVGDSRIVLPSLKDSFDLIFTCPPYWNLEKYSKLEGDLSNMRWSDFSDAYRDIIAQSCALLKNGGLAIFVVGEVRGRDHYYKGLIPCTINAMMSCGMGYYNEAIYYMPNGSAAMRADCSMKYGKLVKVHQNILMFQMPDRGDKRKYNKKVLI